MIAAAVNCFDTEARQLVDRRRGIDHRAGDRRVGGTTAKCENQPCDDQ
jgi:hypothetical protein